jgi:hypothetical protein
MLIHKFKETDGSFPIDEATTSAVVGPDINSTRTALFQAVQGAAADVDVTLEGSMDNVNWSTIKSYVDLNNENKSSVVTLFPYMRVVTANAAGTVTVSCFLGE